MSNILLFAAGSLRGALGPLLAAFQVQTGAAVETVFGPAGLLRQRIETGERPHIFASANLAHPQRLVGLQLSSRVEPFARNRLCATVRNIAGLTEPPLLEVLLDSRWRVATSTPGAALGRIYSGGAGAGDTEGTGLFTCQQNRLVAYQVSRL
ncbi:substrate-binding domain-containing protein [Serratia quinivorans]|uniref:substrate-binding domain-containing protein n=1 Tax=Serratia quinivorans TaxID=137545 RepID=UPI00217C6D68|nr:molybdate ABC transporter periplasmic molybdate-binding protein [Serratia quinivorans]CAI1686243.1 molybdate ABC transporter periplasmic molybdate-binding protein [Serratia quinivorans]